MRKIYGWMNSLLWTKYSPYGPECQTFEDVPQCKSLIELQDKDRTSVLDVYASAKLSSSKELWVDDVVIGDKLP